MTAIAGVVTGSSASAYEIKIEWSEGAYDIATNTSPVYAELWFRRISSLSYPSYNLGGAAASIVINGSTVFSSSSVYYDTRSTGSGTNWILLGSGSATVTHDADGSKTINISASFTANASSGMTGGSVSGTATLVTIPRAATMSGYANFNIGSNVTLSISNPGSLYNTLDFIAGGVTVKSVEGVLSGSISTLITASTLYGLTPNSNTLLVTAQLKTWTNSSKTTQVGDTQIATASAIVTNSNPIFTDFDFADIDTTVMTLTDSDQKLVSGYSDVRASVTLANKAAAQNSATMDKYRLTIGTQVIEASYSDSVTVNLDLANVLSGAIKVEAIDSRGNSTPVTKTATLLSLTQVYFNSAEILRDNGADSTVKLDLSGKLHLLNFGTVTNSLKSVKYAYKETSQSDDYYSTLAAITASVDGSGNITISDLIINGNLGSSGFTVEKSYNIKLVLQDELTTATLVIELLSGVYVVHLGRTGAYARVGVGMKNNVGQGLQVKDGLFDAHGGRLCPPGMSFEWNGAAIPSGYLEENGTAVSRTTYSDLFSAIGTTFGSGDGSTTFNLPNSKGRVVVGCDSSQTEFNTITKTGGHKLMQSHTHQELSNINYAERANLSGSDWSISPVQRTGYASGSVTNSTGGGDSENLQPYVVKYRIIKY